jgi:hypothetical protein
MDPKTLPLHRFHRLKPMHYLMFHHHYRHHHRFGLQPHHHYHLLR